MRYDPRQITSSTRLVAERDLTGAWLLARELEPVLGRDRELERPRLASTWPVSNRSDPPGAAIAVRRHLDDPAVWHPTGTTPIDLIRSPAQSLRFRAGGLTGRRRPPVPNPRRRTASLDAVVDLDAARPR